MEEDLLLFHSDPKILTHKGVTGSRSSLLYSIRTTHGNRSWDKSDETVRSIGHFHRTARIPKSSGKGKPNTSSANVQLTSLSAAGISGGIKLLSCSRWPTDITQPR